MGRFIVKLDKNKYVEWSSIVDAPVTFILNKKEMLSYLDEMYGKSCYFKNRKDINLADEKGTSSFMYGLEILKSYNRAGEKEEVISFDEIMERYKRKKEMPYWICGSCAKDKKWKFPKHPITTKIGSCEYCKKKKKQTLIPIVDFDRGKDGKAIWD